MGAFEGRTLVVQKQVRKALQEVPKGKHSLDELSYMIALKIQEKMVPVVVRAYLNGIKKGAVVAEWQVQGKSLRNFVSDYETLALIYSKDEGWQQ